MTSKSKINTQYQTSELFHVSKLFLIFFAYFISIYSFNKLSLKLISRGHSETHTGSLKINWKMMVLLLENQ